MHALLLNALVYYFEPYDKSYIYIYWYLKKVYLTLSN